MAYDDLVNQAFNAMAADHDYSVKQRATAAANKVLESLCNRKGIGQELLSIKDSDNQLWQEISNEIEDIISSYIE